MSWMSSEPRNIWQGRVVEECNERRKDSEMKIKCLSPRERSLTPGISDDLTLVQAVISRRSLSRDSCRAFPRAVS